MKTGRNTRQKLKGISRQGSIFKMVKTVKNRKIVEIYHIFGKITRPK
jgi:hypothetical protein